jgi:hypothetical protein
LIEKLKDKYTNMEILYRKVFKANNKFKIPYYKRLMLNLKGFTADEYVLYNLKVNSMSDYISEYHRWKSREINGRYKIIFDDKLIFAEIFGKYLDVPRNLAWVKNGKIYDLKGGLYKNKDCISLLDKYQRLIIKPVIHGGGGKDISLITKSGKSAELNYKPVSLKEIVDYIKQHNDAIITEFVEQHPYASELYDKTTNTIRLITIMDNDKNCSKIIAAVHRIGTKVTIPVDNASIGGLVSKVDLESGTLGLSKNYDNKTYEYHPDSGKKIIGTQIPYWTNIKEEIKSAANMFPYIRFIAWDIVVTRDGFAVIEGNASTGLKLFQLWCGARNTELGRFFEEYGLYDNKKGVSLKIH